MVLTTIAPALVLLIVAIHKLEPKRSMVRFNPRSHLPSLTGDFLWRGEGEDVVHGSHVAQPLLVSWGKLVLITS